MKARLLWRIREAHRRGVIEGVISEVPEPVQPSEHRIKYRLVYVIAGERIVGYDNERGKGDHKHSTSGAPKCPMCTGMCRR